MNKKDITRIEVKYGIVKRKVKKSSKAFKDRRRKELIFQDMKHAREELLDFLGVAEYKTLDGLVNAVNTWLDLEAKMTGFKPTKYTIGEGENIFKKIVLERAIYHKK